VQARAFAAFLAVASLALGSSSALADDPADADALIEEGVTLREQGRDREALALFDRALGLNPSPRAVAQVALARQALGEWVEAERGLLEALGASPPDPWIERHRLALQRALTTVQDQLAWVTVDGDVPGAEVRIDGGPAVALPMREPVRVPAGVVVVEVRVRGYEPTSRHIEVRGGDHALLAVLRPGPPVAPVSIEAPLGTDSGAARRRVHPPAAAWVSLGSTALLLGAGVAADVMREVYAAKYNSPGCVSTPGRTRDDQCGSDGSTARTATAFAIIGYSTAGIAAAATAYFFLAPQPTSPSRGRSALSACGVAPMAVHCAFAF
jgi:hypothetical protein